MMYLICEDPIVATRSHGFAAGLLEWNNVNEGSLVRIVYHILGHWTNRTGNSYFKSRGPSRTVESRLIWDFIVHPVGRI